MFQLKDYERTNSIQTISLLLTIFIIISILNNSSLFNSFFHFFLINILAIVIVYSHYLLETYSKLNRKLSGFIVSGFYILLAILVNFYKQ